jgi:hypothetical protein
MTECDAQILAPVVIINRWVGLQSFQRKMLQTFSGFLRTLKSEIACHVVV